MQKASWFRSLVVAIILVASSRVIAQTFGPTREQPPYSTNEFPRRPSTSQSGWGSGDDRSGAAVEREGPLVNPFVPARSQVALETPIDPDRYICGRGDQFELNLWGPQNIRIRAEVDAEGRIFVPRVGYVIVQGKTLSQTRVAVKAAIASVLPRVRSDLSLSEPRIFLVHVVGAVAQPGVYAARPTERVSVVISRAGGALANAGTRRIRVTSDGRNRAIADLPMYALGGGPESNPYLLDGDVIHIPFEELPVQAVGAVNRPGRYELIGTKDVHELIQIAGGLSVSGTRLLPIRLLRRNGKDQQTEQFVPFTDGTLPPLPLQTDDVIEFPGAYELQRSVLLVGAVAGASPGLDGVPSRRMPFVDGDTVRTLLDRAGGITPHAEFRGAVLHRKVGIDDPLDLEALLVRRDFSADRRIEEGDTMYVPLRRTTILVQGAVSRPDAYPYNPTFRAIDYISLAGGQTRLAQAMDEAKIIRPSGDVVPFAPSVRVDAGDTIVVPERTISRTDLVQLSITGASLLLGVAALFLAVHR